ncbi:PTS system cellobiose-specific IIC component [Tetragenococcus muriaticus PMC-11-5]|uniref:PTS system cellobiose-specific IIC component n=1 Tax=Tetragenococcus muriaticus PMC-11-5 TaxID=1302649 RepID=A0A091BZV2_9ENTE|nr:PTS system cellobiose-specific IIC component [Tetragenococcus muriaticus PMC-11-5]
MNPMNGALLAMFALFMTVPQLVFSNGEMSLVNQNNEDAIIVYGWEMVGKWLKMVSVV